MGFLDRAKQMAEQAQSKLDEAQKKFNESQKQRGGQDAPAEGAATAYDQHGRPVPAPESAKKQGDPIVPNEKPPPTDAPAPKAPVREEAPGDKLHGDPADALPEPPKVTPGDPLAS